MNLRLLCTLLLFILFTLPVQAQTPCSDCFYAAEEEARKCLDNAISAGDRNDCLENRRVRLKACSDNQCQTVREEMVTKDTQPTPSRPGLAPYTPTEGEWLALVIRAGLRREASPDQPYSIDIVLADPETIQIVVRYQSTANRDKMNQTIAAAKEAIRSTARSYGWDKWVKIRESVEMSAARK